MKIYIQNRNLREKWNKILSIFPSFIFCLKYLPFRQAIKLPILVRNPKFVELKGTVKIDAPAIYFGMIKLGFLDSRLWPDTGIIWSVMGNITFKGKARIGAGSSIFVGRSGNLVIGDDFRNTANLKILCCCQINFGKTVSVGWDSVIMDSGLHPIINVQTGEQKKSYGAIEIGDYNWFGLQCLIMHSVKTPERCIFAARSVVTRGGGYKPYCTHGGMPMHILSNGVMRDFDNDRIRYK